jgi:protein-tyrosine sulfotransferase
MTTPDSILEQLAANAEGPFCPRPVFILGIAERSGTNYLQDLLRLHPDCDVDGLELEEDHFVAYADLLVRYVNLASKQWKSRWGQAELQRERDMLCQCIGDGLVSYLRLQVKHRRRLTGTAPVAKPVRVLVTKTPDVTNLHLFFKFFPNAELLILVRDGRAVVESAVRTFYRNFADETRKWAARATAIQRFVESESSSERKYLIVRYEDLYTQTNDELRKIMSFLRMDPALYDFEAAINLPVRGSSSLRQEGAEWRQSFVAPGIHWNPVPKGPEFKPLERWRNWSRAAHQRFNWIAGKCLPLFGYEMELDLGNRWLWVMWNMALDFLPIEPAVHGWRKVRREMEFSSNKFDGARRLLSKLWSKIKVAEFGKEGL